jgi:hypothetical protein
MGPKKETNIVKKEKKKEKGEGTSKVSLHIFI